MREFFLHQKIVSSERTEFRCTVIKCIFLAHTFKHGVFHLFAQDVAQAKRRFSDHFLIIGMVKLVLLLM